MSVYGWLWPFGKRAFLVVNLICNAIGLMPGSPYPLSQRIGESNYIRIFPSITDLLSCRQLISLAQLRFSVPVFSSCPQVICSSARAESLLQCVLAMSAATGMDSGGWSSDSSDRCCQSSYLGKVSMRACERTQVSMIAVGLAPADRNARNSGGVGQVLPYLLVLIV